MNILSYCIVLICFYLIGSFILDIFKAKFLLVEKIALSFLLGNCVVIFLFFFLSFFRSGLLTTYAYAVVLVSIVSLLFKIIRYLRASQHAPFRFFDSALSTWHTTPLFICYLFIAFYAGVRTMNMPVNTNDTLANWSFAAKVIYTEQTIYSDAFTDKDRILRAKDYPLFISLTEVFMLHFGKSYDDKNIKVLFFAYYLAFMIIFYYRLRSITTIPVAYLVSIALFSLPALIKEESGGISSAMADMPLTLFHTSALLYLYDYLKTIFASSPLLSLSRSPGPSSAPFNKTASLWISSLLLTGVLFIKNEGMLIYFALCIALTLFMLRIKRFRLELLFFIFIPFVLNIPWFYFKFHSAYPMLPVNQLTINSPGYLLVITGGFLSTIAHISDWGLIWLLPICSLLHPKKLVKGLPFFVFIFIILHFFSYFATLMILPTQIQAALPVNRFLLHLLPESLILFLLTCQK